MHTYFFYKCVAVSVPELSGWVTYMETDFPKTERVMKRRKKYRICVVDNTLGCNLKVRCLNTVCSGTYKLIRFPPCVDECSFYYFELLYYFEHVFAHTDWRNINKTHRFKNWNFKGYVITKAIQNYASDCVRIPIRNQQATTLVDEVL